MEAGSTLARSGRHDEMERLLDEKGRSLGIGRARVAFGRSGIALGFPRDPTLHISWWVVAVVAAMALGRAWYRRRRS